MKEILNSIAQIPARIEPFCGQFYKYIRLEEAIYVAEDADSKLEKLRAENEALKARIAGLESELSFANECVQAAIKDRDYFRDESESRLGSYLAQIDATKVALDKAAELESELAGLRDAYSGAMDDKRIYKKRFQALEKCIAGGMRVYVNKLNVLGWIIGESEQANATLLLDEQGEKSK